MFTFLFIFKIILKLFKIIYLLLGSESLHLAVTQVSCRQLALGLAMLIIICTQMLQKITSSYSYFVMLIFMEHKFWLFFFPSKQMTSSS